MSRLELTGIVLKLGFITLQKQIFKPFESSRAEFDRRVQYRKLANIPCASVVKLQWNHASRQIMLHAKLQQLQIKKFTASLIREKWNADPNLEKLK